MFWSKVKWCFIYLSFVGFDTDTEGDEDIHLCKKCKLVFTNLSDYLQHKVKHDNYKVKLSRTSDRRMLFPQLIQKPEKSEKGSEKENLQRKRRGYFAVLIDDQSDEFTYCKYLLVRWLIVWKYFVKIPTSVDWLETFSFSGKKKTKELVNPDLVITERQYYWCPKCNIKFNR